MRRIKKNTYLIKVDDSNKDYFWNIYEDNTWEPETFNIFDRFIVKNSEYIDIGAWIGPTVLYGSNIASKVYAIEPDKQAYRYLRNNINLNQKLEKKIVTINKAISTDNEPVKIHTQDANSSSSLINHNDYKNSYLVDGITIDKLFKDYTIHNVSFVKIDVEGFEYFLLPKIMDYFKEKKISPSLHVSIHLPFLKNIAAKKYSKYPAFMQEYFINRFTNNLTSKLINSLKEYKYFYYPNGSQMKNPKEICTLLEFDDFVVTNHKW